MKLPFGRGIYNPMGTYDHRGTSSKNVSPKKSEAQFIHEGPVEGTMAAWPPQKWAQSHQL